MNPVRAISSQRGELREFLQAKRAALKPEDVGLQGAGRRRAPGLRREEVASLATVGLTWYTWLEQGVTSVSLKPFCNGSRGLCGSRRTTRATSFLSPGATLRIFAHPKRRSISIFSAHWTDLRRVPRGY